MLQMGDVFKVSPGGTEAVLHSFSSIDGAFPLAGLIADSNGNLYGTTALGAAGAGLVFKLTGTGFVPPVQFNAFKAALDIQIGKSPGAGTFELLSEFTLGHESNGINPPAESVTLQIGTFTTTIPPGSFKGSGFGPFNFVEAINGVNYNIEILPAGTKRYAFSAVAEKAPLTGTTNPVPVNLTIGADTGTVSVRANISH